MAHTIKITKEMIEASVRNMMRLTPEQAAIMTSEQIKEWYQAIEHPHLQDKNIT